MKEYPTFDTFRKPVEMSRWQKQITFIAAAILCMSITCCLLTAGNPGWSIKILRSGNPHLLQANIVVQFSPTDDVSPEGNTVFTVYDKDSGWESFWIYDASKKTAKELPHSCAYEYAISRNGRFVCYWDIRPGHDGLLIYDIENDSIKRRIAIADNLSTFTFLNDDLLYSIDAGVYFYDTAADSVSFSPQLSFDDDFQHGMPDKFAVSDDYRIFIMTESIDDPFINIYDIADDKFTIRERLSLPASTISDIKIDKKSDKVAITYESAPLLTVIDLHSLEMKNSIVNGANGEIIWSDDNTIHLDYPRRHETISITD